MNQKRQLSEIVVPELPQDTKSTEDSSKLFVKEFTEENYDHFSPEIVEWDEIIPTLNTEGRVQIIVQKREENKSTKIFEFTSPEDAFDFSLGLIDRAICSDLLCLEPEGDGESSISGEEFGHSTNVSDYLELLISTTTNRIMEHKKEIHDACQEYNKRRRIEREEEIK